MKHFLRIGDFEPDQIQQMLDASSELHGGQREDLLHKNILFTFEKPSLRTKVGTEVAINHLGGDVIHIEPDSFLGGKIVYTQPVSGEDARESLHDTVKNVSQWCDAIFARVFKHKTLEVLARYSEIPIINALCDQNHPMQAVADLYTIQQKFGRDEKVSVSFIGDANNVAFSLIEITLMFGHDVRFSGPRKYYWSRRQLDYFGELANRYNASFTHTTDPKEALRNTDVFYTDSFVSMGEEQEYESKIAHFRDYQITTDVFQEASSRAGFMHCLPAHRGIEVTDAVMDHPNSWVLQQAQNRMIVSKGVFTYFID